ncbi:MAG: type-F conjugative transfer system protein TraW [Bryobacterales bacterium]|nr:type-F conjugative transfer system protein TraW [Bryobacterales bacterium]
MKHSVIASLFMIAATSVSAAEQIGPIYPIAEPHMLQEIMRVLREKERSGELAKLQREAIARSKRSAEEPKPVEGLTRTSTARTFYWDPTVRAPKTITDPQGRVVVQAGTAVNPLDHVSMTEHLLFFDGRDQEQVAKAAEVITKYEGRVKAILVGGPVLELTRKWKFQVYFDQGGYIVRKLGIKQVPALVTQDGRRLRIDELEVKS